MAAKKRRIWFGLTCAVLLCAASAIGPPTAPALAQRLVVRRGSFISPTPVSGAKPPPLVNADDELASFLVQARDSIKKGNYDQAIEILQALIDKPDSGFVAAADGRQYVALWHRANEVLATMGREGMELYRRLYNPQAMELFERAAETQDTAGFRRLTQQLLHTAYGAKALSTLGAIHFDRGQFARAAMYWRRALRLKAPGDEPAVLLAKISAALHFSGDSAGSKAAGDQLTKEHPKAVGVMGGRKQDLAEYVAKIRKIPVPSISARQYEAGKSWRGLGAVADGMAIMSDCDVVLTPSWRLPDDVPIGPVDIRSKMIAMQTMLTSYTGSGFSMVPKPRKGHVYVEFVRRGSSPAGQGFFMPPGIHPVVVGKLVICRREDGVAAYHIDGTPGPSGKEVWFARYSPMYRRGAAPSLRYYSGATHKIADSGRYAMTVSGDLIYLLAKFVPPVRNPRSRVRPVGKSYADTSVLQAISVSRNGRLMWQSDDQSVNSDDAVVRGKFVSVPTVHNGRLYSLVTFREMYHLVCLNADTGKLIWRAAISQIPAMATNYRRYNQHLLGRGSPVAVAEGMAFVATNAGVIAAFEAESGAGVWAYQYNSGINRAMSRHGSVIQLPGQPSVNPIIVANGRVISLPVDSSRLLVLSAIDGKQVASSDRRGQSDLSAIDAGRILLSGPGLVVVSTANGSEIHRAANSLGIVGRPAVSAKTVLAGGQGRLIRMKLDDYSRIAQDFANSDCLLGNLVCVDGKLIAANTSGVCVYLNYDDSIANLTRRMERCKDLAKINLMFDRGQLSFNSHRLDGALADFKSTLKMARGAGQSAVVAQVTHWLYRTHVAIGNSSASADKMRKHFEDAAAVADTLVGDSAGQYQVRSKMRLARVLEVQAAEYQTAAKAKLAAGDKPAADELDNKRHAVLTRAVVFARQIAETYGDKRVPDIRIGKDADNRVRDTEDTVLIPAAVWTQQRFVPQIIAKHGRKCYAAFDDKAGQALRQAVSDNDSDAMIVVSKRWPNSLWAAQAMFEAGAAMYTETLDSDNADDHQAMARAAWRLATAEKMADDPMLALAAMAGRATIYQRQGMANCARSICRDIRRLCRAKGVTLSETVEFAGSQNTLTALLRKLEGPKPLPIEPVRQKESLAAPLKAAFTVKGSDIFIVRDQEYRPIRRGTNVLLINGGKAVWFNTAAKSAADAVVWQSGAPTVAMDRIRNYMNAPGYGIVAGFSGDGKTVALADRTSTTGFDLATGKVKWRGTAAGWGISSMAYMAAGDGILVAVDSSGKVVCVELTGGSIRWVSKLVGGQRAPVAPPRIARGVVLVRSNNYKLLTCFNAAGGRVLWKWAGAMNVEGRATDEGLVLAMADGVVTLHDPARMSLPLWARKYNVSDKPMLLTVDGGRIFVSEGMYSPWVDVVNMGSGGQITRLKAENFSGPKTSITHAVATAGHLYLAFGGTVSSGRNRYFGRQTTIRGLGVQRIDLATARVAWHSEVAVQSNVYFSTLPLGVTDRTVVMTSRQTQYNGSRLVHLIDAEKGNIVQTISVFAGPGGVMKLEDRTRLQAMAQPVIVKGRLLVESLDGLTLYEPK